MRLVGCRHPLAERTPVPPCSPIQQRGDEDEGNAAS